MRRRLSGAFFIRGEYHEQIPPCICQPIRMPKDMEKIVTMIIASILNALTDDLRHSVVGGGIRSPVFGFTVSP